MSSLAPSDHPIVTANDHGAIVSIATLFSMTTFIIAVLIRIAIRLAITRYLGRDDYIMISATVLGIGQSIAVLGGVHNGLGKKEDILSNAQVVNVEKAQYASDIFYMASLCLAKISILLLLERLSVSRLHKRITYATVGVVGIWAVIGIIALATQCGSSSPWATSSPKCINLRAFWISMAPIDVITELVVIILPVFMLIPVQVAMSKKAVIVAAFIFRLFSIVATVVRLFYIHPATMRDSNATFNAINYNIVTQCVLSVSITTACVPCLKPFLDGFESGFLLISFKGRMPGGSNSLSYRMNNPAYINSGPTNKGSNFHSAVMRSQNYEKENMSHSDESDYDPQNKIGVSVEVVADSQNDYQRTPQHHRGGDSASVASSSKSDQMIIKKNVRYTVQYEEAAPQRRKTGPFPESRGRKMRDDKNDGEPSLAPYRPAAWSGR